MSAVFAREDCAIELMRKLGLHRGMRRREHILSASEHAVFAIHVIGLHSPASVPEARDGFRRYNAGR